MGLFSGLFGGGGGGSSPSATTTNQTTVTVEPVTNVKVETKEIAEAIAKGAALQAQTDLQSKTIENQTKVYELQQEHDQNSKRNYQILGIIVLGTAYIYFRKGGK